MNKLFVNANVSANIKNDAPHIKIEDRVEYQFSPTSNITKLYSKSNLNHIQDMLNGGTYLVIENKVIDFRDSLYKDYVNDKIKHFIGVMGYLTDTPLLVNKGLRLRTFNQQITLGKYDCQSSFEINGATYETGIFYNWSPFMTSINGVPYLKQGDAIIFLHSACKKLLHKFDWITYHNNSREQFTKEIRGMFETIFLTLDTEDATEQEINDLSELFVANGSKLKLPDDATRYELVSAALKLLPKISSPGFMLKFILSVVSSAHQ